MKTLLLILCACLSSALCFADPATPITLDVKNVPLQTALATLSKETNIPILAEDTVSGTVVAATIANASVEPILDSLVKPFPGVAWQKIYLAKGAIVPDAGTLAAQIRALKTFPFSTITVWNPATHGLWFYAHEKTDTAGENGPHTLVYLLTNETLAAQREAAKTQAAAASKTPVNGAVSSLQSSADQLAAMTPDEQRQALPLMFQQFQQMMQSIDPSVMSDLRNQFRQQRQQGQGAFPGQ